MRAVDRLLPFVALVLTGCAGTTSERPRLPAAQPSQREPAERSRDEMPADRPSAPDAGAASGAQPGPTVEDRRTFDEVNRMRAEHGLRALRWDDRLFVAARDHSAEQRDHAYMGHGSPDPARDALADRLALAGCARARKWAEVVAWGYEGPQSVVLGWMNSSGHRHILLDPELTEAAFSRVGDSFTGDFSARGK